MAKTTAKKTSSAKTAETTKPEKKGKASKSTEKSDKADKSKAEDKDAPKRKLGLRGAAPWAARRQHHDAQRHGNGSNAARFLAKESYHWNPFKNTKAARRYHPEPDREHRYSRAFTTGTPR